MAADKGREVTGKRNGPAEGRAVWTRYTATCTECGGR